MDQLAIYFSFKIFRHDLFLNYYYTTCLYKCIIHYVLAFGCKLYKDEGLIKNSVQFKIHWIPHNWGEWSEAPRFWVVWKPEVWVLGCMVGWVIDTIYGWVLRRVNTILYGMYVHTSRPYHWWYVRRAYTNLVHTSSLERALNPANRRGRLTRSLFRRGLHKATSG